MIRYAQLEFEQGNVELLTPNLLDGIEAYKDKHRIKDNFHDASYSMPYRQTDVPCQQIANLRIKASGLTVKEDRKVKSVQRDIWSAAKYGLRVKQVIEETEKADKYSEPSSWSEVIREFTTGNTVPNQATYAAAYSVGGILSKRKVPGR